MHDPAVIMLLISLPVSGMLFFLTGFRPFRRRDEIPAGHTRNVCPTCHRPL